MWYLMVSWVSGTWLPCRYDAFGSTEWFKGPGMTACLMREQTHRAQHDPDLCEPGDWARRLSIFCFVLNFSEVIGHKSSYSGSETNADKNDRLMNLGFSVYVVLLFFRVNVLVLVNVKYDAGFQALSGLFC